MRWVSLNQPKMNLFPNVAQITVEFRDYTCQVWQSFSQKITYDCKTDPISLIGKDMSAKDASGIFGV